MDRRVREALDDLTRAGLLQGVGGHWDDLGDGCRVQNDSRLVRPGDIFACVCGRHFDGHSFVQEGQRLPVAGFMIQRPVDGLTDWILTSDTRAAMGFLAARMAGMPAERLTMVGVTGTNGKSTSSYMVRSVLHACGLCTGLVGTVVYHDGHVARPADRTTPESVELQRLFESMVRSGCRACVMECSSHGIDQGRLNGCRYDGALFTNLSPEHLDYHGTLEAYFEVKSRLFTEYLKPGAALSINGSDPWGRRLSALFPKALTWAVDDGRSSVGGVRLLATGLQATAGGSTFGLELDGRNLGTVRLPMTGRFNVENALGAAALCLGLGCREGAVIAGLEAMPQVPGRMERLCLDNGVTVVVDFAHTAEALENLLATLRPLTSRLVSVFGHGGERFAGARPLLGKTAGRLADRVWITMDNPRREDPAAIAQSIVRGLEGGAASWTVVLPRREAIRGALDEAKPGDVVAISGKGAEPYLEIDGVKYPYSDRAVVEEWAQEKGVTLC